VVTKKRGEEEEEESVVETRQKSKIIRGRYKINNGKKTNGKRLKNTLNQ
jgi:hypothetical protein